GVELRVVQAQWFFDEHVLAVLQRGQDLFRVDIVERRHRHQVDGGILQHLAGVGDDAQLRVFLSCHLAFLGIDVAQGDNVAGGVTSVAGDVLFTNTQSEDAGPQPIHHAASRSAPATTARWSSTISSTLYSHGGRVIRRAMASTTRRCSSESTARYASP